MVEVDDTPIELYAEDLIDRIGRSGRGQLSLLDAFEGSDRIGMATGRATPFGMDKLRDASAPGWVCSTAKAQEQLDFAPAASLQDRYHETVAWYREHGWL